MVVKWRARVPSFQNCRVYDLVTLLSVAQRWDTFARLKITVTCRLAGKAVSKKRSAINTVGMKPIANQRRSLAFP
jgi:hypothetical protein